MVEVYFFIEVEKLEVAVECGLKLSEWGKKELIVENGMKRCISALLNPKDDEEKYNSSNYKCVKLEILPKYCFVADVLLYKIGSTYPDAMKMYEKSIIPLGKYTFGMYRIPECLITTTVLGDNVTILDKRLDSPILYDSSEELYINNLIEEFKEKHDDFYDAMLYSFFIKMGRENKVGIMEDERSGISAFIDRSSGRIYIIKIPDMRKYLRVPAPEDV